MIEAIAIAVGACCIVVLFWIAQPWKEEFQR